MWFSARVEIVCGIVTIPKLNSIIYKLEVRTSERKLSAIN